MTEFEKDIAGVINKHCKENASNTPDFILAQYLEECLKVFNFFNQTQQREHWYGRDPLPTKPGIPIETLKEWT